MFEETDLYFIAEDIIWCVSDYIKLHPIIGLLLFFFGLFFFPFFITKLLNFILKKYFKSSFFYIANILSFLIFAVCCFMLPVVDMTFKLFCFIIGAEWQWELLDACIEIYNPRVKVYLRSFFSCSFIQSKLWKWFLRFVILCNIIYCLFLARELASPFQGEEKEGVTLALMFILGLIGYLVPIIAAYLIKTRFDRKNFRKVFEIIDEK